MCKILKERIGEVAGYVYDYLEAEGEASVTSVVNAIDVPATKTYMAIGWLAHEEKIGFKEAGRGTNITLR